jgi:NDP-sugar pyrophosphorylase family protein
VEDSVIADNATIGEGAILKGVRVWPHKTVERGVKLEGFSVV